MSTGARNGWAEGARHRGRVMSALTTPPAVRWWHKGAVGHILFDNPGRRNAMTFEMWQELASAARSFFETAGLRVVRLSGAGEEAFVAGADISEFETRRATPAQAAQYAETVADALAALRALPMPSVAAIRGVCVGGGVEIALACDIRLAAPGARFGITPARLGLGYGHAGVMHLVRAIGPGATADLLMSGRLVNAAEAQRIGLVSQVADSPGAADALFASTVKRLADNAPLTLRAIKAGLTAGPHADAQTLASVAELVEACAESDDFAEGRRAFAEKRPPRFRGC